MTSPSRVVLFLAAVLLAAPARAQVSVSIELPSIRFEVAPALVTVSPGIQVVENYRDEVYFVDGWYWVRRDSRWFRTRNHRGGWVVVERGVPPGLTRLPPGKYKHFKGKKGAGNAKHAPGHKVRKAEGKKADAKKSEGKRKSEGKQKGPGKGPSHSH